MILFSGKPFSVLQQPQELQPDMYLQHGRHSQQHMHAKLKPQSRGPKILSLQWT